MALVVRATGNVINATDPNQYHDLLTGAMTDQPVLLSYAPASTTTTPTLQLKTNGNAPLLQALNGTTQELLLDASGNLTASGVVKGQGTTNNAAPLRGALSGTGIGGDILQLSTAGATFNFGIDSNNEFYIYDTVRAAYVVHGASGGYDSGSGHIMVAGSAGGGAPGRMIFEGTTDPGGSANEGDIWVVG